jgi:hypothetical protein
VIRVLNAILSVVLLIIGIDTLLRLLGANPGNIIVGLFRRAADWLLTPFASMFSGQGFLLTAVIGAIAYWLLAVLIRRLTPRRAY